MHQILAPYPLVQVYIDDMVVYSQSLKEHLEHLETTVQQIGGHGLRVKPEKCTFGRQEIKLLEYMVHATDAMIQPKKIRVTQGHTAPKSNDRGTGILVTCVLLPATHSSVCHDGGAFTCANVTKGKVPMEPRTAGSFESLQERLCKAPVLIHPDFNKSFELETDAPEIVLGAVLRLK